MQTLAPTEQRERITNYIKDTFNRLHTRHAAVIPGPARLLYDGTFLYPITPDCDVMTR